MDKFTLAVLPTLHARLNERIAIQQSADIISYRRLPKLCPRLEALIDNSNMVDWNLKCLLHECNKLLSG